MPNIVFYTTVDVFYHMPDKIKVMAIYESGSITTRDDRKRSRNFKP